MEVGCGPVCGVERARCPRALRCKGRVRGSPRTPVPSATPLCPKDTQTPDSGSPLTEAAPAVDCVTPEARGGVSSQKPPPPSRDLCSGEKGTGRARVHPPFGCRRRRVSLPRERPSSGFPVQPVGSRTSEVGAGQGRCGAKAQGGPAARGAGDRTGDDAARDPGESRERGPRGSHVRLEGAEGRSPPPRGCVGRKWGRGLGASCSSSRSPSADGRNVRRRVRFPFAPLVSSDDEPRGEAAARTLPEPFPSAAGNRPRRTHGRALAFRGGTTSSVTLTRSGLAGAKGWALCLGEAVPVPGAQPPREQAPGLGSPPAGPRAEGPGTESVPKPRSGHGPPA